MTPAEYIYAARVPHSLQPQKFGLWTIERHFVNTRTQRGLETYLVGFTDYTLLRRPSWKDIHLEGPGEVVMEDSVRELSRHLPIWMKARGRVLVTGLGLGCVVRGLLISPHVEHIDVIELDQRIIDVVGLGFVGESRVTIYQGDALEVGFPEGYCWDYAWHDLWDENDELQRLHGRLLIRYRNRIRKQQGAWAFPRYFGRLYSQKMRRQLLGSPKVRLITTPDYCKQQTNALGK
jgi:hypothetical protein